jgi:hypothetical protein
MTEKDIDIYYKTILDLVSLAGKVMFIKQVIFD